MKTTETKNARRSQLRRGAVVRCINNTLVEGKGELTVGNKYIVIKNYNEYLYVMNGEGKVTGGHWPSRFELV